MRVLAAATMGGWFVSGDTARFERARTMMKLWELLQIRVRTE